MVPTIPYLGECEPSLSEAHFHWQAEIQHVVHMEDIAYRRYDSLHIEKNEI